MTSSLVQRYQKARSACAFFHLENQGVLSVSGPDARDFLQRLGTQDIGSLTAGQATQTLFLKGDGRLVADAVTICTGSDQFLLLSPAVCHEGLKEFLDRYHFAENLKLEDKSADYFTALLTGPGRSDVSGLIVKSCEKSDVDCISTETHFAPNSQRTIVLIPSERFSDLRTEIYETVQSAGGVIGGEDLYESLRIEEGVPRFGADVDKKTIPLEASQKPAISFTKGCFPGQEIVARINNLGHPANVLVGLALPESTDNLAGRALQFEGKAVGRITSTAFSPGINGMLGLGYVKWNQREAGTELVIDGEDQLKAAVTPVPLAGLGLT